MVTNQEKGFLGFSKVQVASAVAILFHVIGLLGIFFNKNFFIQASSLNQDRAVYQKLIKKIIELYKV